MKTTNLRHLFLWSPSTDTAMAAFSFVLVVVINNLWRTLLSGGYLSSFIEMSIIYVGMFIILPFYWMVVKKKQGLDSLGLTGRGWLSSLLVSLLIAGGFVLVYALVFGINSAVVRLVIVYISLLGLLLFIHGWLQLRFEEAFGLIPAVILAGLCFSLMNIGCTWFDFTGFVAFSVGGLVLASVFRLTRNILILWPFLFPVLQIYPVEVVGIQVGWVQVVYFIIIFLLELISIFAFFRIANNKMKPLTKKIFLGLAVVMVVLLGYLWQKEIHLRTAIKAKTLCSNVFISKRDPVVVQEDLPRGFRTIKAVVDYEGKSVTATFLGLARRRAIFREGLGCTLVIDRSEEEIRRQAKGYVSQLPPPAKDLPWPERDLAPTAQLPPEIDEKKLTAALNGAFAEPGPDHSPRRTIAVVVVYNGRIIAERYAPGLTKDAVLLGYSMTKSVTSALVGILVGQGRLSLKEPAPVAEWSKPGDPRGAITLDQLLRMSSGLRFDENYFSPFSDISIMVNGCGDKAAFAANKALEAEPDTKWSYSTGTTHIIARLIRRAIGGSEADYFAFPHRVLFDRIGMRTAIIDHDASGTFLGGSRMYATARDWARFGLLYLQDGVWEGERILPEGWVAYSRTPTPAAPMGFYGAQWWLNGGSPSGAIKRWMPRLPTDLYSAVGYGGQFVTIVPSRNLIVVRLGRSKLSVIVRDQESLVASILKAIPQ